MSDAERGEPDFEDDAFENTVSAEDAAGSTRGVGESIDDGRGRVFPCDQCGADLTFSIGQQSLQCPFCGSVKELAPSEDEIRENDFRAMLARMHELHERGEATRYTAADIHEVRCRSCGANVVFQGTLTSSACPYCASPLQRDQVHDVESRIRLDGVLPFLVPRERAATHLQDWVRSRWFAPNDFKKMGARGQFEGCYLPFFTFDSATYTRYVGQRGDHYYVTVRQGNKTTQQRRTRWSTRQGAFDRFFDDVLVLAVKDEHARLIQELEPWPLGKCHPFNPEMLAGFFARTYDVELEQAFNDARKRMDEALRQDICRRIGGNEQRITSQNTAYNAITFKYLLLPVWLLVYRYRDQPYQVVVNAATGEVQGERPYSWVKITAAVLAALAIVVGVVLMTRN